MADDIIRVFEQAGLHFREHAQRFHRYRRAQFGYAQ